MKPVTAVIIGAGHRSFIYAGLAKLRPDLLRIVGVADPDPARRRRAAQAFGFGEERCYPSARALAEVPKFADAAINGTMDQQHVATSLPLLRAGYDLLLEKPFAIHEEELTALEAAVRETGRKVMICHVLRYAPFYQGIKARLPELGDILGIQTTEHVSHHHMAVSYVRGKWRGRETAGHDSILLAKCSHDLDILCWMMSGHDPRAVSSFGGQLHYRPGCAPEDAGSRCLVDCPAEVENNCPYSARRQYLQSPDRWAFYVWSELEGVENPTDTQREALLRVSDYGKCVYRCGNTTADTQTVIVRFDNGTVASHNLMTGTCLPRRTIHITGTKGEIEGNLEEACYTVRLLDPHSPAEYTQEVCRAGIEGDAHGGGDLALAEDFVRLLRGETPSPSCTMLEDSLNGHRIVFAADRSMRTGQTVLLP